MGLLKTVEEKAAAAKAKAEAEVLAAEAEAKAKAEKAEEARLKAEKGANGLAEADANEAAALGIVGSKVKLSTFKGRDNPVAAEKEKARHDKLAAQRLQNRIAQAKANAKLKPIDKREALLVARFKAIKSKVRPNTYTDKNIKAWIEELKMINRNPKSWNKATANGTKPYVPDNRKARTASDILDGMDLE